MTIETRTIDRRRIDIDPAEQAECNCPKCAQKAWKRELRRFDGNASYSVVDGKQTSRTWFAAYEYLQWTCWTCGYSFETNTLEDYLRDRGDAS